VRILNGDLDSQTRVPERHHGLPVCAGCFGASVCGHATSIAEIVGRIMNNEGMKLTDKGRPTVARHFLLTTLTLMLLAAMSAQAAQKVRSTKNPALPSRAAAAAQKGSLSGLAQRLRPANVKSKPRRTPAPFQRFGS
jgi:hypothetical protein